MTIAVDVDLAWATAGNSSAVGLGSGSFSPAAGSLIIVEAQADGTGSPPTWTITDDLGSPLDYTEIGTVQEGSAGGFVRAWWAYTTSAQTGMTVSVDFGNNNAKAVKVTTYTGAANAAPVSKAAQQSGTNNTTVTVTNTYAGGLIAGSGIDWNANGTPASTDTDTGYNIASLISGTSVRKAATTGSAGQSVGLNFDAAGTGTPIWAIKVWEIIPALYIKEILSGTAANTTLDLVTASDTAVDDVLLVVYANDYYTAAEIAAPTGTAGSWTDSGAVGDLGSNNSHVKAYWRPVTSGGAQTVTTDRVFDEEFHTVLYVIRGADTSAAVDDAAGSSGGTDTAWVAPSVTPASAGDLLICMGIGGSAATNGPFTPPTGMHEDYDANDGGGFSSATAASQALTASGATGTRTFTATTARIYAILSVAIQAAGGGSSPDATIHPAVIAVVAAFPSASKSTGSTVSPSAIAAATTLPTATAGAGSSVTPAAIAASTAMPAGAVSTGSTVAPGVVAAVTTTPAAGVQTGSTVSPSTVGAVAAVPTATVTVGGSATVTPAVIAVGAALPGAALSTGSTVAPAAIVASTTLPAASASGGATVTPSAIAARAALPAGAVSGSSSTGHVVYTRLGGVLVPSSLRGVVRVSGSPVAFG